MRPLTKIGLGLMALLLLIAAGLVAAYWWPLLPLQTVMQHYPLVTRFIMLGLAAIVALIGVIFLLVALLRRTTHRQLILPQKRGQVSVSQQAVENAVTRAVKQQHDVRAVDVQVALNQRDGARAKITADPRSPTDLVALAKAIEATAKQQLTNVLGVPAKHVKVSLKPAT